MRPEVVHKAVPGGKAWHKFVDGADQPVCGVVAEKWVTPSRMLPVHKKCEKLCPWKPRLNRVMTEEEIARELD